MDLEGFLLANHENTVVMADLRRGLRTSVPSAYMLRHLSAAGVDISRQVLPEAFLAYAFTVSGSLDRGVGLGAAVASLECAGSTAYTDKGKTLSYASPLEKRLFRMAGRPVSDCVQEVLALVDRTSEGIGVNPRLLEDDIREWTRGKDVPITRWIFEYHRALRGE